jgi:hypothetical protein
VLNVDVYFDLVEKPGGFFAQSQRDRSGSADRGE